MTLSQPVSQTYNPSQIIDRVSNTQESGCLHLCDEKVDWRFYFHKGQLIYASHSVEPSERLERNLYRLSNEYESLTLDIRQQICRSLSNYWLDDFSQFPDYQAIVWLNEQQYLSSEAANVLIQRLTQEVLEAYLLLPSVFYKNWIAFSTQPAVFCQLNPKIYLRQCRQRLRVWQTLKTYLYSPYQRPYFILNNYAKENLPISQQQKFSRLLKGANFYQLSALMNRDELVLARRFYHLIEHQSIILREPLPPFARLPRLEQFQAVVVDEPVMKIVIPENQVIEYNKKCKIACINNDSSSLNKIAGFLSKSDLDIILIDDPVKALMEMSSLQPDLILIDTSLPNFDGYRLCSLIRKSSLFKTNPIILITTKSGFFERAKAKLSGATDYLNKPFTQVELLKVVFRHLS